MKLNHAFAGALALALISLAPAAHAQSALEWAVSQGAAPTPKSGVLRNRGNRGRIVAQAPLDIRSAPQIVAEAARYIGTRNPYRFRGPGCKVFLNMVARRAGYYANASARAFDTRGMGQRVSYPQPGDYRVSARRGGGHAELVAEVHGGSVTTINGNKGGNRVGWSHRSIGLARIKLDPANPANSLINIKTTTYDTGWMVLGKTVLAMAESSADVSTLPADVALNETYATDPGGWTTQNGGTFSVASNTATVTGGGTFAYPVALKTISTVVGRRYTVLLAGGTSSAGIQLTAQNGAGTINLAQQNSAAPLTFIATTTTSVIKVGSLGGASSWVSWTGIKVAASAADVSGSGNSPVIVGNPTRAVVASGADTAGYGFGSGNYFLAGNLLNAATDCFMRVKWAWGANGTDWAISWGSDAAFANDTLALRYAGGQLCASIRRGGSTISAAFTMSKPPATANSAVWAVVRGTSIELWLDSRKLATATVSASAFSNASGVVAIGADPTGGQGVSGNLANVHIGVCAPTPDQIAFIDADEKARFAANAQSLITGANVQGVAYDPDTEQLAAPNSTGGCDVFKGSVRVANDNSVTGAINRVANSNFLGISSGAINNSQMNFGGTIAGITASIVATGKIGQNNYIDIQISGTASASNSIGNYLQVYSTVGAVIGETWSGGFSSALIAGSMAGLTLTGALNEWTAAVANNGSANFTPYTTDATLTQRSATRTLTGATTAYVGLRLQMSFSNGAVINATIRIYQPILAKAASLPAYSDGLSNSANAKAASFAGGKLAVVTAAGVDVWIPAADGLRAINDAVGSPKRPFYDPTWGQYFGVTTDATPTVFASIPIPEGKAFRFRATVVAVMYGGTATEKAVYDITGVVSRDIGGNVVVVSTTTTISEVTSSMDCIAQANTTAQTLEIKATGKAATRIAWFDGQELYDVGLMAAA